MNPAPNLFFIGPMGAGKTTIGRRVANLLGLPFFDLDHEIEARTGATIPLIFDVEGEGGFRQREVTLLREFAARSGIVLATGGGAVLDMDNRKCLQARGFVVFLETTVEEQLSRLARDRKRPLLAAADRPASNRPIVSRRDRLRELAGKRDPLYREIADLTVPAAHIRNVNTVAQQLVAELARLWQRDVDPNASAANAPGCAA